MSNENENPIFIVCMNDETAAIATAAFKRTAALISAVDSFTDVVAEQDENDPNLLDKIGPAFARFIMTLTALYPNAGQMAIDAKSFGDFTVRTIPPK